MVIPEIDRTNIDFDFVKATLNTKLIGNKIYSYNKVTSTNELAKRIAEDMEEGVVVAAEQQTRGKGRQQRKWFSPKNTGIWMSIILRPSKHMDRLGLISLLSSISVCQAIENLLDLKPKVKWPNDILVNKKKICGILIETEFAGNNLNNLVVGIGLNVNQKIYDFPEEIQMAATSLHIESKTVIDRDLLLIEILQCLDQQYSLFLDGKFSRIINSWTKRTILSDNIVIQAEGINLSGLFWGIDEYGRLCLKVNNELIKINSGNVHILSY